MPTDPVVPLGPGALVAWLALVAVVSAFVAWGLTEGAKRGVIRPIKDARREKGLGTSPLWRVALWGVSLAFGIGAGAVLGGYTPVDSTAVGALVGIGAGAAPAWIVQLVQERARKKADKL